MRSLAGRPSIVRVDSHQRFDALELRHRRRLQQNDSLHLANTHARQSHFRTFAQTIGIDKARSQVQLLAEGIDIAGSVEHQEDQHADGDQHEDADSQLTSTSC